MPEYELCPAKAAIDYLMEKDRLQNGSLQRIESKVDRLFFSVMTGLGAVVLALVGVIVSLLC